MSRLETSLASKHLRMPAVLFLGLFGGWLSTRAQPANVPAPPGRLSHEKSVPRASDKSPASQAESATNRLAVYELRMAPKDLARLERSGFGNDTYPASFVANDIVYENVRVRFRGDWARTWPKKPLKIFFNEDKPFEGRHCLNLNSAWRDPAFVREALAYHLYNVCGVPASRSRMARLDVNGQFRGLYVEVEQPDKSFLHRRKLKGASLFKAVSRANRADERDLGATNVFSVHYRRETRKTEDMADLQSFCHELARTTNALDFFTRRVDLEKYIGYLAATVLSQNWDCFNKNHFLLYDGEGSKKWWGVPWDLDRTFGDHWAGGFDEARLPILLGTRQAPGTTGWNRMADRFFSQPALRARFLDRLSGLLDQEFTTEKLFPIIDRLETEIAAVAAQDRQRWPAPTPDLHQGIVQLKSYIKRRRAFLLTEVAALRQSP